MTQRCLRKGIRRARVPRRCSNGHAVLPGDTVRYWVGVLDGEFQSYEECTQCVAVGYQALPSLPLPERGPMPDLPEERQ